MQFLGDDGAAHSQEVLYCPYGYEYVDQSAIASAGSVSFRLEGMHSRTERFDLLLSCRKRAEGGLTLCLCYDPARYSAAEIARLSGQYRTLLQSALSEPDTPVDRLALLPAEQLRQVLVEWNATATAYAPVCAHTLFETHAARTPQAEALVYEGERLTYAALNVRANQLAHYLRTQGVGPGVRVGLCLERSLGMIVGLLGILKAGGVYGGARPGLPPDRLAFLLADSQAALVVTHTALYERLGAYAGERLCLEAAADRLSARPRTILAGTLRSRTWPMCSTPPAQRGLPRACRWSRGG